MAGGAVLVRLVAQEAETPLAGDIEPGDKLKQGFIDRAQLFSVQVPVVYAGEHVAGFKVTEPEQRLVEVAVGQPGFLEMWALVRGKESAQGRLGEPGLTSGKAGKGDEKLLPAVVMAVIIAAKTGALPQDSGGVALVIEIPGHGVGLRIEEDIAVFRGEQEQKTIDKAEQFLEKFLSTQFFICYGLAQGLVGRVSDKASTKDAQSIGNTVAQLTEDPFAIGLALVAPLFEDAVCRITLRWH